jgi:hypothetical protein
LYSERIGSSNRSCLLDHAIEERRQQRRRSVKTKAEYLLRRGNLKHVAASKSREQFGTIGKIHFCGVGADGLSFGKDRFPSIDRKGNVVFLAYATADSRSPCSNYSFDLLRNRLKSRCCSLRLPHSEKMSSFPSTNRRPRTSSRLGNSSMSRLAQMMRHTRPA